MLQSLYSDVFHREGTFIYRYLKVKKLKYVSRTIHKNDTKGKCARGTPLEVWKNRHPEIDNSYEN